MAALLVATGVEGAPHAALAVAGAREGAGLARAFTAGAKALEPPGRATRLAKRRGGAVAMTAATEVGLLTLAGAGERRVARAPLAC